MSDRADNLSDAEYFSFTADGSERLDLFLARVSGQTRSFMRRVLDSGGVSVNGAGEKAAYRLRPGDTVEYVLEPPRQTEVLPEDIPLDIVYEDSSIAVINKPKGMVVHPAPGNESGTLVNAVMYHIRDLSGIGGELRPGIVHRIDKLTSGLIVIAKNDRAHLSLAKQLQEHTARRTYIALAEFNFPDDTGTVDAPIARDVRDRKRMAVDKNGRAAVTHYKVLHRFIDYTLLRVELETGRTHQIRVHMAYIKHPLAGDTVYGSAKKKLPLDGQALHAAALALDHPETGERMTFFAPLPEWYTAVLSELGLADAEGLIERELGITP